MKVGGQILWNVTPICETSQIYYLMCKVGGIVQGDEGPIGGVAQVVCHGVIVVVEHQEGQEEEVEKAERSRKVKKRNSKTTAHHGW